MQFDFIPKELKTRKQWANLDSSKIPNAKSNDQSTWLSFKSAVDNLKLNTKFIGLNYAFNNDYMVIDLDNCIDEFGNIRTYAQNLLDSCKNKVYAERSISGKGIHIILKCNQMHANQKGLLVFVKDIEKFKDYPEVCKIEVYTCNHFCMITGDVLSEYKYIEADSFIFNEMYKFLKKIKNKEKNTDDSVFKEIKSKVTIEEILNYYGLVIRSSKCKCPIHTEQTGSLHVYAMSDSWYCFGCMQGGDIINLVALKEKITAIQAAKKIDSIFSLGINFKLNEALYDDEKHYHIFESFTKINKNLGEYTFDDSLKKDSILASIDLKKYGMEEDWGCGYYITQSGFIHRGLGKIKFEGDSISIYTDRIITPIILYPSKLIWIHGKEEVELTSIVFRNKKIYNSSRLLDENDSSSVASFRKFLAYFKKPASFDGNSADMSGYLEYLNKYISTAKIQREDYIDKFGWDEDNNFHPYADKKMIIGSSLNHLEKCFNEKGNEKAWMERIEAFRQNINFDFLFCSSLASIDKHRPKWWTHNIYRQSGGKTAAMIAIASTWGFPGIKGNGIMNEFNLTFSGLEFLSHTMGHLPVFLNELQGLDSQMKLQTEKIVYDSIGGLGKIRGTISGQVHEKKYWDCNFISNGEEELLKKQVKEGASKRCIQLYGCPIDLDSAKEAYTFFQENYGFFGKKVTKYYIENIEELNEIQKFFDKELFNDTNMHEHIMHVATACKFAYIANILFGISHTDSLTYALIMGQKILNKLVSKIDVDLIENSIKYLISYVMQNRARFYEYSGFEQYGFVRDGIIYIFPNILTKILENCNCPEERFIKEVKIKRYANLDSKGYFPLKKYKGQSMRLFSLVSNLLFFETEEDEERKSIVAEQLKIIK